MIFQCRAIVVILTASKNCRVFGTRAVGSKVKDKAMTGHDVFISYSSKNKTTANALCHALEQNGVKCWIAPRDIPRGEKYTTIIETAITECKIFVIIFSKDVLPSPWVDSELTLAFEEEKAILSYRIDETRYSGGYRLMLQNRHWIEAYPEPEEHFGDLLSSIKKLLSNTDVSMKPIVETKQIAKEKVALERRVRKAAKAEATQRQAKAEAAARQVEFKKGDPIKITEGPFENHEGIVDEIFPDKCVVRVIVPIFDRPVPLELECWQFEKIDW